MQLIAGRTAREYNKRKRRKGAFREDRYHATAVASDAHLFKGLTYIDLNKVRAGVIKHPSNWKHGGYQEIQHPPERYRIIDLSALMTLAGYYEIDKLQQPHSQCLSNALVINNAARDPA